MKSVIDTAQNMTPYVELLRARSVNTVIRYYNHNNSTRLPQKRIDSAEANALSDAGFDLAVVFQQGGGKDGAIGELDAAHGRKDAAQALKLATALGQPAQSAIYFAVDHDYFRDTELRNIEPYFAEVRQMLDARFRVGVYGSGAVGARMQDRGLADLVWLAGAKGWAGTRELLKTSQWALFQGEIDSNVPGSFSYDGNDVSSAYPDFGQFRLKTATDGDSIVHANPPSMKVLMAVRARSGLKLRRTPGIDLPELNLIPNETIVTALGKKGDWVLVDLDGDGTADGFMHADFLETVAGGFPVVPVPGATAYDIAQQELALGIAEIQGTASNPRILMYHNHTSLKATTDEVAWCSSFVNYCVDTAGLIGTHSAAARSWHDLSWGTDVTANPRVGDIVVFSRQGPGAENRSGHVGFWIGDTATHVTVLGGNQGNCIKISNYPKTGQLGSFHYNLLSIRRP